MLPHEKLEVYRKALDFVGGASAAAVLWDKRHAVADQFSRASDSLILNIAEGNGRYWEVDHRRFLDLAATAAVKVAAGLDLAVRKGSWAGFSCEPGKSLLERIIAMLSRM